MYTLHHVSILSLQATALLACTFVQVAENFHGELKHELELNNFYECVQFCFYDPDCLHVSANDTDTERIFNTSVTCGFYMRGTAGLSVHGSVFRADRAQVVSTCKRSVRCAGPVKRSTAVVIRDITIPDRFYFGSAAATARFFSCYVNNQGFHIYTPTSHTSQRLLPGYSTFGMLSFYTEIVQSCKTLPIFVRGDYNSRFFFGEEYNQVGYVFTETYAYIQNCTTVNNDRSTISPTLREYKNKDHDDYVYTSSPPAEYVETDFRHAFWIAHYSCNP